ncbi:MAG: hypothetical protein U9N48_07330 [Euryarchaeota archaeon]|nr:hypothetical protein [Euryarchaeota archaeon]
MAITLGEILSLVGGWVTWSRFKKDSLIIITIAAFFATFRYVGIYSGDEKINEQSIYVTSYDQKGGITANQVNIGVKQQRHFDDSMKSQMSDMLQDFKGNKKELHYQNGDKEAFIFASEIKSFLQSESWEVNGPMPTQWFGEPHTGVLVIPPRNGFIKINVYAQQRKKNESRLFYFRTYAVERSMQIYIRFDELNDGYKLNSIQLLTNI